MWQYWGMRLAQRLAAMLPSPTRYRLAVLAGGVGVPPVAREEPLDD